MKVLWSSLVKFPPLSSYLGEEAPVYCSWMYSSAKALIDSGVIDLAVAIASTGNLFQKIEIERITYYLIPYSDLENLSKLTERGCLEAIQDFNPDLIHLHGIEYSLSLGITKANFIYKKPLVASIQGLASAYVRYADGGLSFSEKLHNISVRDIIRFNTLFSSKKSFDNRGIIEAKILSVISDVIGRTFWDKSHVLAMNDKLIYHLGNETLRDEFYVDSWAFDKCKKYRIFVSNSCAPLKGAHQVMKALPLILKLYPDTKVYFVGVDVTQKGFVKKIKMNGYQLYLKKLISQLRIQNNVCFVGSLSAQEMKEHFLRSNLYVLPSSIENSPNSLCEAQMLGVPAISAYCGGTMDFIKHAESGFLYRYEEYEVLAMLICDIFDGKYDLNTISRNEKEKALSRHGKFINSKATIEIYKEILNRK